MQFVPFKEKLINDNREARIGQPNNLKLPSALTRFLISPPAQPGRQNSVHVHSPGFILLSGDMTVRKPSQPFPLAMIMGGERELVV